MEDEKKDVPLPARMELNPRRREQLSTVRRQEEAHKIGGDEGGKVKAVMSGLEMVSPMRDMAVPFREAAQAVAVLSREMSVSPRRMLEGRRQPGEHRFNWSNSVVSV